MCNGDFRLSIPSQPYPKEAVIDNVGTIVLIEEFSIYNTLLILM